MDKKPGTRATLELVPMEPPAPKADESKTAIPAAAATTLQPPAAARPPFELPATNTDPYMVQAAKEYRKGFVDEPLWQRASGQWAGDEARTVAAYMRSRAAALRLQKKPQPSRRSDPARTPDTTRTDAQGHPQTVSARVPFLAHLRLIREPRYLAAAAAGVLVVVIGLAWLIASRSGSNTASKPMVAKSTTAAARSATPTPPVPPVPVASAAATTSGGEVDHALAAKVAELKNAGNWNLFVLYATEVTRNEPNNALAWSELSGGYVHLRQWDDALTAATKSVQLAPNDERLWRNLGQLHLALDRFSDAGAAFAKALEIDPADAEALCGAASVALQLSRPKNGNAITKQVPAADGTCSDFKGVEGPKTTSPKVVMYGQRPLPDSATAPAKR